MESPVAVVIVNYNTREDLRRCLESVLRENPSETIVVDNASTDGSQALVRDDFPEVRLLANADNPGYGGAANQGIRTASAPYVLLLNSDTVVGPGTLRILSAYLDGHPRAGLTGPRLVFPDLRHQPSTFPPPTPFNTLVLNTYLLDAARVTPGLRMRFQSVWEPAPAGPVAWVKGAALAIRKTAFEAVEGFDEGYFMYSEEVDLCHRLQRGGWEVHFTPEARVIHVEGASTSAHQHQMSATLFESLDRFYRKHWSPGRRLRLRLVVVLIMVQRILRGLVSHLRNPEPDHRARLREDRQLWIRILRRQLL